MVPRAERWALPASGAVCAACALLGPQVVRVPAALALTTLLPGYALQRLLFGDGLAPPERALLTLSLSVATGVLGTLMIDLTPLELTAGAWVALLAAVTCAAGAAAARRDRGAAQRVRLRRPRTLDAILAACAVALVVLAAAIGFRPLPAPDGVKGYSSLTIARHADGVEVGVESGERSGVRLRLEVLADRRPVRRWSLVLRPGDRWSASVPTAMLRGSERVEARLLRSAGTGTYRRVRVHLRPAPRRAVGG